MLDRIHGGSGQLLRAFKGAKRGNGAIFADHRFEHYLSLHALAASCRGINGKHFLQ